MCGSTFRHTDYTGGCNGVAIRFSPQIDWPSSEGASDSIERLDPIFQDFPSVSAADIIALAGLTAVEAAGGKRMPFCGGRVDAEDGAKSEGLEPRIWNNDEYQSALYNMGNTGMSLSEGVALLATPKDGSTTLSNKFFVDLKAQDPARI
jgi:catalase (peroxidase I)